MKRIMHIEISCRDYAFHFAIDGTTNLQHGPSSDSTVRCILNLLLEANDNYVTRGDKDVIRKLLENTNDVSVSMRSMSYVG
jgi:hypothetical protein